MPGIHHAQDCRPSLEHVEQGRELAGPDVDDVGLERPELLAQDRTQDAVEAGRPGVAGR